MDEQFDRGGGVPASDSDGRRWLRWSVKGARAVIRRTAKGESLRAICRDPDMPGFRTVVGWMQSRPKFAAAMRAARERAGRSFVGRPSGYCAETAEAIFERLCAGEGMVAICRDPAMPAPSTVYKWMKARPEFAEAVALAREIQGDRLGELGWEIAQTVEPRTAHATRVKLAQLRWYAGKLSPRKYGAIRAAEPPAEPKRTVITLRHFWIEEAPDGRRRVRASHADPETGRIVDEPPREWQSPPPGQAIEPRHPGRADHSAGRWSEPSDPEGWT